MIYYNELPTKFFSESVVDFLRSYPWILETLEINHAAGSSFSKERGILTLGVHKQDWITHELGHVIASSYQNLLIPDFGNPIASKYEFDDILIENTVFRFQVLVALKLDIKLSIEGSIKYINKQTDGALIDPTAEKILILKESTERTFRNPFSQSEFDKMMDNLYSKISYLKHLKKDEIIPFKAILPSYEEILHIDDHEEWEKAS